MEIPDDNKEWVLRHEDGETIYHSFSREAVFEKARSRYPRNDVYIGHKKIFIRADLMV